MNRKAIAIFLLSAFSLFLELVLIRWIGTEVSIFAYLQNTLLVTCFVALGLGMLATELRPQYHLRRSGISFLFIVTCLSFPSSRKVLQSVSLLLSKTGELTVWNEQLSTNPLETIVSITLGLIAMSLILFIVIEVLFSIGAFLGEYIGQAENVLHAYAINILGSLVGAWTFIVCGRLLLGPTAWCVIAVALFLLILISLQLPIRRMYFLYFALTIPITLIQATFSDAVKTYWSPYQKIELYELSKEIKAFQYTVMVNNFPFQSIANRTDQVLWDDPRILYDVPPFLRPGAQSALVVGAGTGNDVAGMLRHNVSSITAVEIDPAVASLEQFNSLAPYSKKSVNLVIDDARSYLAFSNSRFDLIHMGMLDSHSVGSHSNTRLDHFVYTKEGLEQARDHLAVGGVMTLSFFARRPFIADRIAKVLEEVFGRPPLAFRFPLGEMDSGGTMFVAGNLELVHSVLQQNTELRMLIEGWKTLYPLDLHTDGIKITTDNWPYLYLKQPTIPLLFILLSILVVILVGITAKLHEIPLSFTAFNSELWMFFFFGAAFLLLEMTNINRAAITFGSSWEISAIIISGLLLMCFLGTLLSSIYSKQLARISNLFLFAALSLSVILTYLVDMQWIQVLSYNGKVAAVAGLLSLPALFSSILFAKLYRLSLVPQKALGANFLGAVLGGLLQMITFYTGLQALSLLVLGLYLSAFFTYCKRSA